VITLNIFAYGELMKDSVLLDLIGRIPEKKKGYIKNYEKFFDESIGYYGVRKKDGKIVRGIILKDISKEELKVIDKYEDEGDLYFRVKTPIYCDDGGVLDGFVYVRDR